MSHAVFRRTFLPPNAPATLSLKLFDTYAAAHSSKELTFEDFAELHFLLKVDRALQVAAGHETKSAMLCFYFYKQHALRDASAGGKSGSGGGDSRAQAGGGAKGQMDDSFPATLFLDVGSLYFDVEEMEII